MRDYRFIVILIIAIACKGPQVVQQQSYSEDLRVHRPDLTVPEIEKPDTVEVINTERLPMEGHLQMELDSVVSMIAERNLSKLWDGFVIQVYSGVSRQDATRVMESLKDYYPDMPPSMEYRQPTYRVQIGHFFDKLEAARIHDQVRSVFPRAILLPKKLPLKPNED